MPAIALRPASGRDLGFLFELHKQTLGPYVDQVWGWADDEQFDYLERTLDVENTRVIVVDGVDAGRLSVEEGNREIYLGLIEVTPEVQGRGIGSGILRSLVDTAFAAGNSVRLHVLEVNVGARRFYSRFGFTEVGRTEVNGGGSAVRSRIEMLARPTALTWPLLQPGDRVRLVSPASFPEDQSSVDEMIAVLRAWGLTVEVARHAADRWGYLAGRDEDRAADLNEAYSDPAVRAVIATRGGAGAYRVLRQLDFDAIRADPKPLVGFSDITYLHLAIWRNSRVPGIHGCLSRPGAAATTRQLLMSDEASTVHRNPEIVSAAVESDGHATGCLMGGNLTAMASMVGAGLPNLTGSIVLIEAPRQIGLGQIDRQLTQLIDSGSLDGIAGVALGQFPGFETYADRGWTILDVLRDRLGALGVPILGGLDVGHGSDPLSVLLGAQARLDTSTGTLTVNAAGHRTAEDHN